MKKRFRVVIAVLIGIAFMSGFNACSNQFDELKQALETTEINEAAGKTEAKDNTQTAEKTEPKESTQTAEKTEEKNRSIGSSGITDGGTLLAFSCRDTSSGKQADRDCTGGAAVRRVACGASRESGQAHRCGGPAGRDRRQGEKHRGPQADHRPVRGQRGRRGGSLLHTAHRHPFPGSEHDQAPDRDVRHGCPFWLRCGRRGCRNCDAL